MVDEAKLHQFIGQMLSDLGGAASVSLVRIGEAFGLYKTLHERGPMTVAELAAAAGVNQRYLREWLSHQAASNYLTYEPATQKFTLPPEQAMVFAIENSPVYMTGAFTCMASFLDNLAKVQPVFKTGGGVAWGDQASCLFCAVAQFFRDDPENLVSNPHVVAQDIGGGRDCRRSHLAQEVGRTVEGRYAYSQDLQWSKIGVRRSQDHHPPTGPHTVAQPSTCRSRRVIDVSRKNDKVVNGKLCGGDPYTHSGALSEGAGIATFEYMSHPGHFVT